MNGVGSYKKKDKMYEVEVTFIAREGELIKVAAKCSGEAKRLALEIAEDLNPHGETFEIDRIEKIED